VEKVPFPDTPGYETSSTMPRLQRSLLTFLLAAFVSGFVAAQDENVTAAAVEGINVTVTAIVPTEDSVHAATVSAPSDPNKPSANGTVTADYNNEYSEADSGKVAGIVIGIIGGLALAGALVAFCVYKQYVRNNVKSMNFDNPVYRKTTEDQFTLEKNQYQTSRSYPATLEPLTNPGTNEFV